MRRGRFFVCLLAEVWSFGSWGEALEAGLFLGGLLNLSRLELSRALALLQAVLAVSASQLGGHPDVTGAVAAGVARVLLLVELDRLAFAQTVEAAGSDCRAVEEDVL